MLSDFFIHRKISLSELGANFSRPFGARFGIMSHRTAVSARTLAVLSYHLVGHQAALVPRIVDRDFCTIVSGSLMV